MRMDDTVRLRHMLDAAREAIGFAVGCTREDLENDRQLILALVKAVEIIGEAAFQLSEETKRQVQGVPWDDVIGMPHRLVHAYFDIDLDTLWRTVQDDLPPLIVELEKGLSDKPL